ncbi:hypothetical protein K435DRAFT_874755 [Dendrothele bispora CBS 962.96]|uniref:Uncharacterized protein n=1 Tax=Dendrothele bispora (strain CBS 962.96) TaxID=1314807 RepID=A0A4S8KW92_DENBC|nr:hypothetical protein K435DRAFT_874755 [Dendrothele bispora CBS 962.96]
MSSPSSSSSRSSLQLFTDTFKKSKLPKEYFPLKPADFPDRTLLDTSLVLGYDKEPWLALLLVALWFPVVLNPAATQKLPMPDQGTLFTMVASALDNYTRWILHPQYSEPVVILALKMGLLKYYKGNLLFRRILKNFPAANTSYDDAAYEEGHRTLDEERHTIGKRLDQKVLLEVQPLAQPLPTGAACPDFPEPEVLPNHYVDIPREGSNLAYPKDNEFPSVVNQEDLPPRFQWIWYVKEDLLRTVFGLSLPKDLRLWLSSPASSVDDDISMADPSETSGTPKAKLADFEADWLKTAFGADFVDEFEAAASPLGHSPSDSGSSDRPLAEKSSSERPPEETKKTSKRKLPASAESAPVAPKKKKREIKLGPVSAGSHDRTSSMKPSGSRIQKNKPSPGTRVPEREHPMDTDFLGDTTPAPVLTVNPALTIGTFPADDANASDKSFRPGSSSGSDSSDSESDSSTRTKFQSSGGTKRGKASKRHLIESEDEDDHPVTEPAQSEPARSPSPALSVAPPAAGPSQTRQLPNRTTRQDRPIYKSQEFVFDSDEDRLPAVVKGKGRADPPPATAGSSSSRAPVSITSRIIGDYVLPPSLYGVEHLKDEIAAATRASQIQAEDRVTPSMVPLREPCLQCGLASKVCFLRGHGCNACLNCVKSGVGCNLAPSKLGRSLDLAAEHAKFSLVHLDALAQDKSRAQLQFELAAANYALAAGNLASSSYRVTSCLVKADTAFPGRLEELTRDSRSSSTLKEEIANLEVNRETFGIPYPVEGLNFDDNVHYELPQELIEWFEKNSGSQKKKNPPPREFLREELERPQSHHAPGSKARSAGRKVRKN